MYYGLVHADNMGETELASLVQGLKKLHLQHAGVNTDGLEEATGARGQPQPVPRDPGCRAAVPVLRWRVPRVR